MTIGALSRYSQSEVLWIRTKKRGNKRTAYLNTVTGLTSPYSVAMLRYGDTFEDLSYKIYRDADRWWVLADANPQVFYPLDVIPGVQIRIPT